MNLRIVWLLMVAIDWRIGSAGRSLNLKADVLFLIGTTYFGPPGKTSPYEIIRKYTEYCLLPIVNASGVNENGVKIALVYFAGLAYPRLEFSPIKKEVRAGLGWRPPYDQYNVSVAVGLMAAGKVFKTKGRTRPDVSRILILVMHRTPEYRPKLQRDDVPAMLAAADDLRKQNVTIYGMFCCANGDYPPEMQANLTDHFQLCYGDEKEGGKTCADDLIDRIFADECNRVASVCLFNNSVQTVCYRHKWRPSGIGDCPGLGYEPNPCPLQECFDHCDRSWPWLQPADRCDVLLRAGPLPYANLSHCPANKSCPARSDGGQQSAGGGVGFPLWIIGAIVGVLAVLALIFAIVLGANRRAKQIETRSGGGGGGGGSIRSQTSDVSSSRSCRSSKKSGKHKSKRKRKRERSMSG